MSCEWGTFDGSAVDSRNKSSGRVSAFDVAGGVALAVIALACGVILYTNIFGASDTQFESARVDTLLVQPASFEPETSQEIEQASFEERFGPFGTAAAPSPEAVKNYFALLDPGHSFGAPPGTFTQDPPVQNVQTVARVRDVETQQAQTDAPLSPTVRQAMHTVPLPPSRPRELGREIAQASKVATASVASKAAGIFEKLFGLSDSRAPALAYAPSDGGVTGDGQVANAPPYDRMTAVYDISARAVYLPNGIKLEAHSGLGSKLDDPRFVNVRMSGATPPHIYDLSPRESLFHGVEALRLKPLGGEDAIYGRTGLLAHTYMLGPNGDSNGCVSFKDYERFLQAYKNGEIKRLAVVAKVD